MVFFVFSLQIKRSVKMLCLFFSLSEGFKKVIKKAEIIETSEAVTLIIGHEKKEKTALIEEEVIVNIPK